MTALHDLQCLFRDAVFEDDPDGNALRAVSEHVNPTPGLSAADHVLIYRRAILGTLVRGLGYIFPVCKQLLGEQFFDAMARVYARMSPSRSPDLANYGEDFADFIAGFEPAESLPYLPDLARLEWLWHRVFHAPDEAGMDTSALGEVPEATVERIVFRLPASAALLPSDFPIHRIWQVNQEDWDGDQHVQLDDGGVRVIVWRQGYDMRIDELNADQWWLLNAIARGAPFGELSDSGQAADFDTLLPDCVQRGWIAGFTVPDAAR